MFESEMTMNERLEPEIPDPVLIIVFFNLFLIHENVS
jgi:hypothetical protein